MAIRLTIIEKAIAIFLILWAGFELYSIFWILDYSISEGFKSKRLTWDTISFSKLIKNYHLSILVSTLTLISATFLLFRKRIGWILTIAATIIYTISHIIFSLNLQGEYNKINGRTFYFVNLLIIGLFLAFTFFLLQKPFRAKYLVSRQMWLTIIIIVGVYLIDRIILLACR